MKKRDAIEAVRRVTQRLRSGATRVGFLTLPPTGELVSPSFTPERRTPEFEFSGWQFFALTGPCEDEPTMGDGDAKLCAPDGTLIGLAWTATGRLAHSFDFEPSFGPMLYVDVPTPVASWSELRVYLEALAPLLDADLRARQMRK